MRGSKFLQRVPVGPQRPSPRAQLALRGALRPGARAFGDLGALGGEWEDWCDSDIGKDRYAGKTDICRMQLPFHPKTMVGQVLRFEAAQGIPSPSEYSSENLWKVMYSDYRRFFEL